MIDGLANGGIDGVGSLGLAEGVAQEHGGREDLGDGVGNALAGDVRRGSAAGFEQSESAGGQLAGAEGGAGEHAEGSGDHGHFVGENVAEEVFGEDDVESARVADELHGGVVDVEVLEGDVGVLLGEFGNGFAPEDAVFEDVSLVDGGDFFAAQLGGLEGDVSDAFDFAAAVDHGVDGDGLAVFLMGALGFSEVEAAGEFTHAEDVEAALDERLFDGGGVGEFGVTKGGAQVGKELEVFAQGQEGGALGLFVGGRLSHLGPPTEPKRMASARSQAAMVASGRALPSMSMAIPPTRASVCSRRKPNLD